MAYKWALLLTSPGMILQVWLSDPMGWRYEYKHPRLVRYLCSCRKTVWEKRGKTVLFSGRKKEVVAVFMRWI